MALGIDDDLAKVVVSVFLFIIFVFAGNVAYLLARRFLDKRTSTLNSKRAARIIEYVIFALGLYLIYSVIGLDIKSYAASIGILGIAVAFSSQQIIQNLMAGLIISFDKPIELEEWVEISGGAHHTGIAMVRDVTLTKTVLRDLEGRLIYLPNSILISSRIINYSRSGFTEVPINVKIGLSADHEAIKQLLLKTAREDPEVLPEVAAHEKPAVMKMLTLPYIQKLFKNKKDLSVFEPIVLVSEVSESGVTLSLRVWTKEVNRRTAISSRILSSFLEKIRKEKISLE